MRISTALFLLTTSGLLVSQAMAQTAPPPPESGVMQSFDGKTLTIKAADGSVVAAALAPNVRIQASVKKTLADIKPGDFIASGGTRGPDGKIHANEIRIFTAPGGEGQFPMTAPGQVMTNATVKQVGSAGGVPVIRLSYHGAGAPGSANCTGRASEAPGGDGKGCIGETQFDVPANIPVVAMMPADASALKPGAKASMTVTKAPDGSSAAARVTVSQ